jgi:hypothetical protein
MKQITLILILIAVQFKSTAQCNINFTNYDKTNPKILCKGLTGNLFLGPTNTTFIEQFNGPGLIEALNIPNSKIKETNSAWLRMQIDPAGAGNLTFKISSLSLSNDDIDFVLYQKVGNNYEFKRYSMIGQTINKQGSGYCNNDLSTGFNIAETVPIKGDGCQNGVNGFVANIPVVNNAIYYLFVNNYYNCRGVKIDFTGSTCKLIPCSTTIPNTISSNGSSNNATNKSIQVGDVYPNPTENAAFLNIFADKTSAGSTTNIILTDMLGRALATFPTTILEGSQELSFPTENLPRGYYNLNLTINNEHYIRRFLKMD